MFKTGKHGKVYNDDKKSKGSKSESPNSNDGSFMIGREHFPIGDDNPSCVRCGTKDLPCGCSLKDGNNFENAIDNLDPEPGETPEETYNRVEPIIEELHESGMIKGHASLYLSDLLNDLEEPNAEPGEFDDGAKIDNYKQTLSMFRKYQK